jgi:proteic killer suppression protein
MPEGFWWGQRVASFQPFERVACGDSRLDVLAAIPGNHLEALKGSRRGQHSIRINGQWRICFRWQAPDAFDVEITNHYE